MSGLYVPVTGPVLGTTVYFNNKLIARDSTIKLPEVTPMMATLALMGEMEVPIWQLIQNMQATITKIGIDVLSQTMIAPDLTPVEFRWVQKVQKLNGGEEEVGCKAFMNGYATNIPGFSLTVGSASENDHVLNLMRYRLIIGGSETVLIDRLAGRVVINGKDYTENMNSML